MMRTGDFLLVTGLGFAKKAKALEFTLTVMEVY